MLRARQGVPINTPNRVRTISAGVLKVLNRTVEIEQIEQRKCSRCSIVLLGLSKLSKERSPRVYNSRTRHFYEIVFNSFKLSRYCFHY